MLGLFFRWNRRAWANSTGPIKIPTATVTTPLRPDTFKGRNLLRAVVELPLWCRPVKNCKEYAFRLSLSVLKCPRSFEA